MEKIKIFFKVPWAHKFFKILKWVFFILIILYILAVIARGFYRAQESKIAEQVEKIHNTKLTMDDVMGVNLPPPPGELADATVEGIDANNNGIRDDVELAVFKEYPNSAKTRAVLLQYALVLQMQMIQPILDTETVVASIQEEDRAYQCIGEIIERDDENEKIMNKYFEIGNKFRSFVKNKQLNTKERKEYRTNFYEKIGSYNSLDYFCDIDYSKLPN
ncbi:hypothetical protein COW91_01965 [Candidatus Nomurabacteria bacterium CG22_combo_CG10-13_8_21_14_all_32_8]|uniref:Uncharacterized protein n=2 Tax=Candidatus Nomuraibacteriota TaxID=1752729 RepID=A0A2H0CGC2_9BACT|nr:MAG: hypothetical protein COW91_01965 [Candidatus Nomurabacteria bacterium CG22_combo_CG10-13_8_21_14_all_32_8]